MRSKTNEISSPPWWAWAACLVLPLIALAVRGNNAGAPVDADDGFAPFRASPSATPPVQPVGLLGSGELAAYPAYQAAPVVSRPAPAANPYESVRPWSGAAAMSATPVVPAVVPAQVTPVPPVTKPAAQPVAVSTAAPIASGPALLPPMAMPGLAPTTPPAESTLDATVAQRQVVSEPLPAIAPPTPAQIAELLAQVQAEQARLAGLVNQTQTASDDAKPAGGPSPVAAPTTDEPAGTPSAEPREVAQRQPAAPNEVVAAAPLDYAEPALPGIGSLTGAKIEERAKAQIAAGYDLARRGAYYAARMQFVGVLRMIAEAKDARSGLVRRAAALARGLQALDEAEDFLSLPGHADAVEETSVLIRSHKTDVGRTTDAAELPPAQWADRYYNYAQAQLAAAVAGEPAGSMALHALGKLSSELHAAAGNDYPYALRQAVVYQRSALLARDDNYLAAHELGVLLAETGHYGISVDLLRQVARQQPNPVVLRNLARVERSLGRPQAATLAEQEAARLAAATPDPRVTWVQPGQFAAQGQAAPPYANGPPRQRPNSNPQMAARPRVPAGPPAPARAPLPFMR